ncbi:MAG: HU family DNA-binding protein [Prevotellaceae bacterium]|jgi:predicted histone-like DNA-binding protein|nr:HU family DNA-binding protein [Prevotellaceae bacterium]
MSILFEWYNNPDPSGQTEEQTLHARPLYNGKADTRYLSREINLRSTVTPADISAVLASLRDVMGDALANGKQVHLKGIGYFRPTLTCTEKVVPETKRKAAKVMLKSIAFRPDKELLNSVGAVHLEHVKHAGAHSAKLSNAEIDQRLEEYFRTHSVLTRRDFQHLCGFTSSTARLQLARLRNEGKLRNEGIRNQPMYVPAEMPADEQ